MTNPFKVGDQVYTVGCTAPCIVSDVIDDSLILLGVSTEPLRPEVLSFKPWPAPCHERPIKDGWWICTGSRNDEPYIREVRYGKVRYIGREFNLEQYTFHKYLGKDWK